MLETLKKLRDKKNSGNGGFLGTGLFSNSPEIDFAEAPEAKVGMYQGITGGAGFSTGQGLERELPDEEARKIYRKELAKQLARERRRQVKERAKELAKKQAERSAKGSGFQGRVDVGGVDLVGGGPKVDIIGGSDGEVEDISLI